MWIIIGIIVNIVLAIDIIRMLKIKVVGLRDVFGIFCVGALCFIPFCMVAPWMVQYGMTRE